MGAGAAGAGVGLLAGALLNEVLKRRAGGEDNYSGPSSLKAGLLGALAVGGGALLAHHNNNNIVKSSSYLDLTTVVANAQGLSQSEKMALAQGIRQLSASEEQVLSRQLRGVAGAAIGAIIGKFLLSKGLLGPIGGAIIGGLLGFGSQSTKTNILGQQYKPYNF
jgi:hypothetical protein